jgi:hypothetical protein
MRRNTEAAEIAERRAFTAAANEVDDALREAEKALRDQGLGARGAVEIWRELCDGTAAIRSPHGERVVLLVFGTRAGKWQLHVESAVTDEPETWCSGDLWSQTLDIRVAALHALPKLLEQMRVTRHQKVQAMLSAAQAGRAFVASLRRGQTDA